MRRKWFVHSIKLLHQDIDYYLLFSLIINLSLKEKGNEISIRGKIVWALAKRRWWRIVYFLGFPSGYFFYPPSSQNLAPPFYVVCATIYRWKILSFFFFLKQVISTLIQQRKINNLKNNMLKFKRVLKTFEI